MDATHDFTATIPDAQITPQVRAALARLADENALLRASLAELRARLGEAEELADRDGLTPLPNRRHFDRELERVVSSAERHGTPAALLMVALNDRAELGARYGGMAGDAALIHVARLLSDLIRAGDVATRIGDDGFGLILDHLDHNSAIETAERLVRCIAASPLDIGGTSVPLTVTVGTASILPGDSAADVVSRAERSLARMKDF